MEGIYKIGSNTPPSSPQPQGEKNTAVYFAVAVFIIAFAGVVFYVIYNDTPEDVKEERIIYTHEEKLKILEGLAGDPVDMPPIEERKEVLSKIAEDKPADAREYSQEEKLNILYSIQ